MLGRRRRRGWKWGEMEDSYGECIRVASFDNA